MITYPELGLPEAWKPLFKAMADAGWELEAALGPQPHWDCREVLRFSGWGRACWLSFLVEPEWCGNHLQSGGLIVAALTDYPPENGTFAEENALLLVGGWEEEVNGFVSGFSSGIAVKSWGI